MAEKLFITFVGKAFWYLCIYFLFLYFLVNIIGISIYTIQPFSKEGIIGLLIYAGIKSWDKVFNEKQEIEQENNEKND